MLNLFFTIIPVSFILQLLITEYLLHKKGIKVDGCSPINKTLFYTSKYLVPIVWLGMILEIWNVSIVYRQEKMPLVMYLSYALWILGFSILYIGRFSLGSSFRIGVANERTKFVADGIYKTCRNPMYVGLFITLFACMLYSLNPIYIGISILIIIVHHTIILGEEEVLLKEYGEAYKNYCKKVKRYL
jgi:protein-S-isoprenylcysteine O-methyltransferase Ste14